MVSDSDLQRIENKIHGLIGLEAWGAQIGVGSFLTIEFGEMVEPIDDGSPVHGQWHLWVHECVWYLESRGRLVVASGDDRVELIDAVDLIDERTLLSVNISPPAFETKFIFDNHLTLHLFPLYSSEAIHWLLYMPDKNVISIGPGMTWHCKPEDTF